MLKNVGTISWEIFDLSKYGHMTLFIQLKKKSYKQKKQDQKPQTNALTAFFCIQD